MSSSNQAAHPEVISETRRTRSGNPLDSVEGNAKVDLVRHPNLVMVKDTPKGRGVFARTPIPARTVVDVSPVLVLDPGENENHIKHTKLWFYTYNWRAPSSPTLATSSRHTQTRTQTQALPLGLGSLFNHASVRSPRQNTGFTRDFANETITYLTLRDIDAGEELCICYGEPGRLGFADADNDVEDSEDVIGQEKLIETIDVGVFADHDEDTPDKIQESGR